MQRIVIEETRLAGLPALHAAPADRLDAPLPTVLVYHGFTRSKELDSNLAFMFARAGLRAVLPEAAGHGERFDGDAGARLLAFWDIVRDCIDEAPQVRQELLRRGLVQDGRLGVAGLSMGGFVALGCLARHEWLRGGVSWMGSGRFLELARVLYRPPAACMQRLAAYDPAARLERLAGRPLLLWHGMRDEIVPWAESARLHAEMVRRGLAQQLQFVSDAEATHKLTAAAAQAGVDFLATAI